MTREQIEAKADELKRAKEQAIAQVNALAGAISVCEEFLRADVEHGPLEESRQTLPDSSSPISPADVATTP